MSDKVIIYKEHKESFNRIEYMLQRGEAIAVIDDNGVLQVEATEDATPRQKHNTLPLHVVKDFHNRVLHQIMEGERE